MDDILRYQNTHVKEFTIAQNLEVFNIAKKYKAD